MMRVIAMILLSLLPILLPAKVATAHLRDYQGNNRLTYTAAGVVLERNDYYPYGGLLGEEQNLQPFKYYGKELETTNGLNLYDFHARYYDYTLPIFTTQDPLQEKTPWQTPYGFCSNNPINRIDPTGMGDIFAMEKNKAVLIGTDGVDDKNVYIVTGDLINELKKATENNKNYEGDLSESENVVKIPTGELMEGVVESVEDTEESQRENGGHAMKGDDTVTRWDEGSEPVVTDRESRMSIRFFKIGGKSKIPNNISEMVFYWHTHPKRKERELSSHGSDKPSKTDKSFQKEMQQSGYKRNTFVIGVRTKNVTFYNNRGIIVKLGSK